MSSALRPAVFLDRDGTIIRDAHYVGRVEQVELLPGAADAIRRLNEAGVPVVVVTNQSGIGRGIFSATDYERVRAHLDGVLAAHGARIDATYHCPHAPGTPAACACRKPARELYDRAALDLSLDPSRSVLIGDRWSDLAAATALGARAILVSSPETSAGERERAEREFEVAPSLGAAVGRALAHVAR